MPPSVLIVEDEQSAARLLASLCTELAVSAHTARGAREALGAFDKAVAERAPFSCVLLDLVLAEGDGFQVAQQLRAKSPRTPLVVISGIYKQLPADFAGTVKPDAFFAKPFEPSQLTDAIARFAGVAAKPAEGRLQDKPVGALLVELLRQKATGVLTVSRETTVRKIYFQTGQVRFAQSNVRSETAGAAQVASGAIKQATFDRAVALAKQQNIPLHEALAAARVLPPEQLKAALKQQTLDAAVNALAWEDGTHRFEPLPLQSVSAFPDSRMSPVALVLEGAKRFADHAVAKAALERQAGARMSRSPELERELFVVRNAFPGEGVTSLAMGRPVSEALSRVKAAELPILHELIRAGLVTLTQEAPRAAPRPHPAAPDGAAEADAGKVFSAAEHEARRMLFGERDLLKDASHYAVLGVDKGATADQIKTAYFAQAKRFHSDSFSGMELGSARKVAEELFGRVSEAYTVLTDPNQKAEYDVYLDRKEKGLPTDVGAILRAEGIFQKGELFFKAGKWADAAQQFRDAIALNHAEAEFHAYLGMAIFRQDSAKAEEALGHVNKALEMDKRLASASLFQALITEAQGDPDTARTTLRKLLQQDPGNPDARRELERMKSAPQKKAGFLSGLFSKK